MAELKPNPCPFCKSANTYLASGGVSLQDHYYVQCGHCKARGPVQIMGISVKYPDISGDPSDEAYRRREDEAWYRAEVDLKIKAILSWNRLAPAVQGIKQKESNK